MQVFSPLGLGLDLKVRLARTLKIPVNLDEYWVASSVLVIFLSTVKQRTLGSRALSLGALVAVIAALSIAAPASAETVDVASAPPSVESPVTAEQPEASVSPAPAPEPVDTQKVASVDVNVPDLAGEGNPVASAPAPAANPPVSTTAVDSVIDRAGPTSSVDSVVERAASTSSAIVDSAATGTGGVSVPTDVEPGTSTVPAPKHPLSKLAEGTRPDPVSMAVLTTDRLSAALLNPALQPADLLDSIVPVSGEVAVPTGPSPARVEPSPKGTTSFPDPRRAGLFSSSGAIAPELSLGGYLAVTGGLEIGRIDLSELADRGAARLPALSTPHAAALTSSTVKHLGGSPTPSQAPSPAPESPANAVPDSGGTSFVPIVALLALLALVAPATLRRLGKGWDFHAPTPFVCALERPG